MRFSIIIPAYNAECTLERCLRSIADQRFRDFQALIVDDGSGDSTAAIAERFICQDPRFVLLSLPHGGPGAARNRGLEQALGEYILYMDADDYWVREDLLQQLNDRIQAHPADAYMYQMVKVSEEGTILTQYTKPRFQQENTVLALENIYSDLVKDGQTLASACNKCIRNSLFREAGITFREDTFGEDIDWVLQLFSHVQTICLMNLDAYAYTQHRGESRSRHPDAANDLVQIVRDWSLRASRGSLVHFEAVMGLVAFEYGICMGSHHRLSRENRQVMRQNVRLLQYGLDQKTKLIAKFHRIFGYSLTCLAIRTYLYLRKQSVKRNRL